MGSSNIVNASLLKKLWVRKLPEAIRIAVTSSDREDISVLMAIADKVWEVIQPQAINAISMPQTKDNLHLELIGAVSSLSIEVKKLKDEITEMQRGYSTLEVPRKFSQYRSRSRSRSRAGSRSNSSSTKQGPDSICWYHRNFGEKATKCILPCNYKTNQNNLNE